ncbi:MAG: hypothetical protein M0P50_11945, partial [Bacteroidales bacterium]|nr:hypothetical protein [Bacteroidales bacterium]
RGHCHFDQNTQRSEVLPGEIYSPMSLSHYVQNFWVKSQNDKGFHGFVKVMGWVTAKPSPTPSPKNLNLCHSEPNAVE